MAANTSLKRIYEPIADSLAKVEQMMQNEMRSDFPFVDELVRYGSGLGGKRLRPALVLLSGQAIESVRDAHVVLASVMEMVHTATLVHDDVLDGADVRRHLATVNARWDNSSSLLLGDFIFARAFQLAASFETAEACQIISRATSVVCEGEIRQKGYRGDYSVTEQQCLEILEAKTAELCACCCQLGSYFAGGAKPLVANLTRYGRFLGIAFQIADDLLDILGDESVAGKSLGTDLQQQKLTLPLIHALKTAGDTERQQIIAVMQGPADRRLDLLLPIFHRFESLNYARDKAKQYAEMAMTELSDLGDAPAVNSLRQLTQYVVDRVK